MGNNISNDIKLKFKNSKDIDKMLLKTKEIEEKKVKLLLLGTGECGKSTIFKQMKLIYGEKYTSEERKNKKFIIYNNIYIFIHILLEQAEIFDYINLIDCKNEIILLNYWKEEELITNEIKDAINIFWNNTYIQKIWNRRNEFQINESVEYYLNKLEDIININYIPNDQDILYLRIRTSGNININTYIFYFLLHINLFIYIFT